MYEGELTQEDFEAYVSYMEYRYEAERDDAIIEQLDSLTEEYNKVIVIGGE